jgi:hypothetical protein
MLPKTTGRILQSRTACLLGALLMAALPVAARAGNPPLTVFIGVENPESQAGPDRYSIKEGSDVFIVVHLTNISNRNLSLGYDKDSRTNVDFSHRYEVRDSKGNPAQERTISHPEIGSTGHGWPARILKPGESMDISGDDISRLLDLTALDKYTVQLLRAISDDPKDGVVKSNTITVTVIP